MGRGALLGARTTFAAAATAAALLCLCSLVDSARENGGTRLDEKQMRVLAEGLGLEPARREQERRRRGRAKEGRNLDNLIPDSLREQYSKQTGLEVDTSNFKKRGGFTGPANNLYTYKGALKHKVEGPLNVETTLKFNFSLAEGEELHAAEVHV